jgi:hypothetical protein
MADEAGIGSARGKAFGALLLGLASWGWGLAWFVTGLVRRSVDIKSGTGSGEAALAGGEFASIIFIPVAIIGLLFGMAAHNESVHPTKFVHLVTGLNIVYIVFAIVMCILAFSI